MEFMVRKMNKEICNDINILYIANTSCMYGANTSLIEMLEELKNRKVNVCVVMMHEGELRRELRIRDIKNYVVSYETNVSEKNTFWNKYERLIINIQCLDELKEIIEKNHINIIHTNASNIDVGAMLAFKYNVPHVFHVREVLFQHYGLKYDFPILSHFFLKRADRVIAISHYVMKAKNLGRNSVMMYNGFNVEKYCIFKENFFIDDKLNILYCGTISLQKGIMDVVKAVDYLVRKGYQKIRLNIIGGKSLYWTQIETFIQNHGLQSYIQYWGYQHDLTEFRQKADVAIMSSRNEALGRVTIESMLAEVLVIGADSGATSELIRDRVTGYLYQPGNVKQLAALIQDVKENKDNNIRIIKNAKKFAMENFNRKDYVDKLLSIYQEISH